LHVRSNVNAIGSGVLCPFRRLRGGNWNITNQCDHLSPSGPNKPRASCCHGRRCYVKQVALLLAFSMVDETSYYTGLSVRLSVCPMSLAQKRCIAMWGYGYYRTLIGDPMLEVEPIVHIRPPDVAEAVTIPSPAPLQKHSPGGCTIDKPPLNYHR